MAKTNKKVLKTRANTVKSETTPKANTADKIGGLIADFIDSVPVEFDSTDGYDVGQWVIYNGRLLQVSTGTTAGQTPATHPAKFVDYVVSSADGITPDGPNYPVLSRALYAFLQAYMTNSGGIPIADEELFGKVRRANDERLIDPNNATDYITPKLFRALFTLIVKELNDTGGFNIPTLEKVLNQGATAKTPILAKKGLTITAGGSILTEGEEEPALFLEDLPEAPEDGEFVALVLEKVYNRAYQMKFSRTKTIQDNEVQTPSVDIGLPVLPNYVDRTFQSGATINFTLAPATRTDGSPYNITLTYVIEGLLNGIAFEPGSRAVNGKVTTETELFTTVVVKAIVEVGPRKGQSVEKSFKLTISPKPVVNLPKPVISDLSAVSYNQGADINIQPVVTHTKVGEWSATGLPSGLSIAKATGKITGSAVTAGTYLVTLIFTDVDGQTDSKTFSLTIVAVQVSAWLKSIAYTSDINNKTINLFLAAIAGVGSVEIAIECLDGVIRTGKTRDGVVWSSDSTSPNYWQTCLAETAYSGQFNFVGFYYPLAFSPSITGGLAFGKKYKVRIRRNSSDTAVVRYFYLNPASNTSITNLLETEPTEGGSGGTNTPPVAPTFGPQTVYVGEDFEHIIDGFTDPDGDILGASSYSFGGYPTNQVSISFVNATGKFRVLGKLTYPQTFDLVINANDGNNGTSFLKSTYTAVVRESVITTIYRRYFPGVGISYSVVSTGNTAPQIRINRTGLPNNTEYITMSKGSDGRYGFTVGQLTAGETITADFKVTGQTNVITHVSTVANPLSGNSTNEVQIFPDTTAGNPTTQLRVGNPDPTNPIFAPVAAWVVGPDGNQWVQVTDASNKVPTYGWKWTKSGRRITGLPVLIPANTKVVLEKTDAVGYDPQNDQTGDKAQLVIETGNPGGAINTQNT